MFYRQKEVIDAYLVTSNCLLVLEWLWLESKVEYVVELSVIVARVLSSAIFLLFKLAAQFASDETDWLVLNNISHVTIRPIRLQKIYSIRFNRKPLVKMAE